jgi:hypothetical protein
MTAGAGVVTTAGAGVTTAGAVVTAGVGTTVVQPASTPTIATQDAIGMNREKVRMAISLLG